MSSLRLSASRSQDRASDAVAVPGGVAPARRRAPRPASSTGAGRTRTSSRWRRGTGAPGGPASAAASLASALAIDTWTGASGSPSVERVRGAVHERPGELERDAGVGEVVLDRLERCRSARRTAGAPSRTRPSCRACGGPSPTSCAAVPSAPRSNAGVDAGSSADGASPASRHSTTREAARAVDATRRGSSSTGVRGTSSERCRRRRRGHAVGRVRVRHDGVVAEGAVTVTSLPSTAGGGRRASGTATQRVLDERLGQRGVPGLLERAARGRARSRPRPPAASGASSAEHAHLAERGPRAAAAAVGVRPRGAHRPAAGTPSRAGRAPRRGTRAGRR